MIFYSLKEKNIFFHVPIILFSLLPFFLITGPFFSDLSISLISLIFLIYCFKRNNFSYFNNKYFYFFLIFWLYIIINSLFNNFNLSSLKISFFYLRYGVFVIAITVLLLESEKIIKYFFYCIFICLLVLILDGFYEYLVVKPIRVTSFFGEEQILGSYLSRLWPIFFGLSLIVIKKRSVLFYTFVLVFVLSEVLIFLSGERAAFFYINLSAVFIILFSVKLAKLRLIILLLSISLIIVIGIFNPAAKERVLDRTFNQMNLVGDEKSIIYKITNEPKNIYIFSKEHTEIYKASFKIFLDNKIFGVGVKNFRNICKNKKYNTHRDSCSTHPHNTYLQLLTEIGLVGFLFVIIILLYTFKYLFKHLSLKFKKKYFFNDFEICILSGIIVYLWPIVPTGNIFNNWLSIMLILNIPFLIWSRKTEKNLN